MARAQLIVMVSHDLNSIEKLCDKAVWLDKGRVRQVGPTKSVINAYVQHVQGGQQQAA
jgi:ABC-type polysaccharide/polyol phosphate transport system ATPase subunit